jgi:hypothetical protein
MSLHVLTKSRDGLTMTSSGLTKSTVSLAMSSSGLPKSTFF